MPVVSKPALLLFLTAIGVLAAMDAAMAAPPSSKRIPELIFVHRGLVVRGETVERATLVNGHPVSWKVLGDPAAALTPYDWSPGQEIRLSPNESPVVGADPGRNVEVRTPVVFHAPHKPTPWRVWSQAWAGANHGITAVAFSPAATWVAAGDDTGQVRVFDQITGAVAHQIVRPGRVIKHLAFGGESRLYVGEQGAEGRLSAYDLTEAGALRRWTLDTATKLSTASADETGPGEAGTGENGADEDGRLSWVSQPGAYRLLAHGEDLFAAYSHSWLEGGRHQARAQLYRIQGATGEVRWSYPAQRPVGQLITWFSTDATFAKLVLPLQRPYGDRAGPGGVVDSRLVVLDGASGQPHFEATIPPQPPDAFAAFWRGVGLSPDSQQLALATEDGRGMFYTRTASGYALRRQVQLAQPLNLAGTRITATNGALLATEAGPIFATGQTYVPARAANPDAPRLVRHPRENTLFGYDWQGRLRWAWPLEADLMGLAWDAGRRVLAVAQGHERGAYRQTVQGVVVLDTDRPGSGAEKLRYRAYLKGQVVFGAVAVSAAGTWVALAEAPRVDARSGRAQGTHRLHLFR